MPQDQDLVWRPERLRCERLAAPNAVGTAAPTFSWCLPVPAAGDAQAAYQLAVATTSERAGVDADIWDSGWVESPAMRARYRGRPLESRQSAFWSVRARTASGETSAWSRAGHFEVGLLHPSDWTGTWVAHPPVADGSLRRAAYLVRRRFSLSAAPARARAFVSALGAYELWANSQRAGDGLLRPGWTDYRRRAQYQVLDLTGLLRAGDNVIGAILAPGWYAGRIASRAAADSAEPVPIPELLCQLEVDHDDGARTTVGTDELWEWKPSAILSSDLYDGEDWDRRLIDAGWASADDVSAWEPVECTNGTAGALVVERSEPVRVTSMAEAQVTWLEDGSALIDSGRNDTGFLRLRVDERAGRKVEVRYGEILDPAGKLYRENLRGARCSDSFVCAGNGPEELAPAFSFRGWRYALASGITAPENLRAAESVTLSTDMPRTGWFSCSEPLLEQIYELMVCSLQANYVDVPTDCPQRDERMGWLADALLFAPLASYTYDISAFMAKWFDDILDARTPRGGFADVAPRPSSRWPGRSFEAGAPAWADAGVLLPWLMYERYGDEDVLEAMFPAMRDWLRLVHEQNPDGIWRVGRGNDYGDWVPAGPDTSHDLFSTCWLYRSSFIGAKVAAVLGDRPTMDWLNSRVGTVKKSFLEHFVDTATGRITDPGAAGAHPGLHRFAPVVAPETQTGYVMPLALGLLDGDLAGQAGHHLADLVGRAGGRLETGFCGSAYLLTALERAGRPDLAYDLLLRREQPSLGFMVDMGATSVWERWDGLDRDGWPACPTMNSFNHYAMSSMLSWLIEGVCGLRPVPEVPATGEIRFAPALSRRLTEAAFKFDAPAGRLELAWAWEGEDRVAGRLHVPAGMTCAIAGTVAVEEGAAGTSAASIGAASIGAAYAGSGEDGHRDRVVGGGDHEVVWTIP